MALLFDYNPGGIKTIEMSTYVYDFEHQPSQVPFRYAVKLMTLGGYERLFGSNPDLAHQWGISEQLMLKRQVKSEKAWRIRGNDKFRVRGNDNSDFGTASSGTATSTTSNDSDDKMLKVMSRKSEDNLSDKSEYPFHPSNSNYSPHALPALFPYHTGNVIPRGAWHLRAFGDVEFILKKITTNAHNELNNRLTHVYSRRLAGKKGRVPQETWDYIGEGVLDREKYEIEPGSREESDSDVTDSNASHGVFQDIMEVPQGRAVVMADGDIGDGAIANSPGSSNPPFKQEDSDSETSKTNTDPLTSPAEMLSDPSLRQAALNFVEKELFHGKLDPFDGGAA